MSLSPPTTKPLYFLILSLLVVLIPFYALFGAVDTVYAAPAIDTGGGGGGSSLTNIPRDCMDKTSNNYNNTMCTAQRNALIGGQVDKDSCEKFREYGYVHVAVFNRCLNFESFIPELVKYILTFASIIAAVVFIAASYKYMTSRGDPTATADAKGMLLNAVIGLIIISLSFVIIQVINGSFKGIGPSNDGQGSINVLPFFELPK